MLRTAILEVSLLRYFYVQADLRLSGRESEFAVFIDYV